jgi:lipopolysaccharide export system protein LptC
VATRLGNNERVFRAALRHSRLVRALRLGIPLSVGIGCVAIYVVFKLLDPLGVLAKLPIGADGVVVSGTKIVMQQPRLKGFTKDKRPYSLIAKTAAQDITKPEILELQDIRAVLDTENQGNVELLARDGIYDNKAERLKLEHNVIVRSPEFELHLSEAVIDVRSGHVVSDHPIEVRMLQATINANRLEVVESGAAIRFERGVTMVIDGNAIGNIVAAESQ